MIRALILSLALLATPGFAEDDHHVVEAQGIRAVHAWANATTGSSALVFVEIANISETTVILLGTETGMAASAELVGLENKGGELTYTPIPTMPVAPGSELVLSPNGLAIRLSGLTGPLLEGEEFEIEFEFEQTRLHAHVGIESSTATQHRHSGHHH